MSDRIRNAMQNHPHNSHHLRVTIYSIEQKIITLKQLIQSLEQLKEDLQGELDYRDSLLD